jgi:hypothetical protein
MTNGIVVACSVDLLRTGLIGGAARPEHRQYRRNAQIKQRISKMARKYSTAAINGCRCQVREYDDNVARALDWARAAVRCRISSPSLRPVV